MSTDEMRVVLIKPGDVLLIGGVRFGSAEQGQEAMRRFKELTGITPVVFFADDIQIDALPAVAIAPATPCCGGNGAEASCEVCRRD